MNERCNNCGAELFERQQFCRQCGAPTRHLSSGEMPTQIFPGGLTPQQPAPQQQQNAGGSFASAATPHASTKPLAGRDTDPVYPSSFAAQYQTPAGVPAALPTETAQLQRKRHAWRGWLIAILCLVVFFGAASFFVAQYLSDQFKRKIVVQRGTGRGVPAIPSLPAIPPIPGMDGAATEGLSPMDEAGAQVSGDKTIITKTFTLKPDAAFTLTQIKGDVIIEGWDGDQAQVTITKRGGDADERAGVEIMHAATDKGLTIATPQELDEIEDVRYEIKLPRALRQVQIKGQDANVTLSNLSGAVAINLLRGNVSATGLTGAVTTHAMKGNVSVDLKGASPEQAQAFNTVSGNIAMKVGEANAVVKAETVDGEVGADDSLDINVERQMAGEHAAGTLGKGGQAIVAKTVSGNIKIKR